MKYQYGSQKITGVAIPVSSLVSEKSCGIGEFADLPLLAEWCAARGIKLIQILPVNDTGTEPTPYSAQSSLALNPVYLRFEDIPGYAQYLTEIKTFRTEQKVKRRVDYRAVYAFKVNILRRMYKDQKKAIPSDPEILKFLSDNDWLKVYAVYKELKERHDQRSWQDWGQFRDPHVSFIDDYFERHREELFFYVWVQWLLDRQLRQAVFSCESRGVMLKGDIPILMNEDSVDVWAQREFFDLRYRAGAPPDMYSIEGQNWGFPVYEWSALRSHNYAWWRRRIARADRYYHAYRIDHVLGFFRICRIPDSEYSGLMGHYSPASYISREDLQENGFDNGRIRWLSVPHIAGHEISAALGDNSGIVMAQYLDQIENQDLYLLKDSIASEKAIANLPENQQIKDFLLYWHRQRALLPLENDNFFPFWNRRDVYSYKSLEEEEQKRLENLIKKHEQQSEQIWEQQARELLAIMQQDHEMLVCAEDLGAVPDCLPQVLSDLQILGLRVERWTRDYKSASHNYVPVKEYPELSVATSSVHDSSTLRGWWQEEFDKSLYLKHIGVDVAPEPELSPILAEAILKNLAKSAARLLIIPLQDFLALDAETRLVRADEERINIPGTVNDTNWSYRIPMTLEALLSGYSALNRKINSISNRA